MSPRAVWRLEAAGIGPVHDYMAGKADWLAAGLPFEGTARLAGMFTRRGVATVAEGIPVAEALGLLEADATPIRAGVWHQLRATGQVVDGGPVAVLVL